MEWESPLGVIRGTPEEILHLMQTLGNADRGSITLTVATPAAAAPLKKPPNNDLLLADYRDDTGLGEITRKRYVRIAEEFERIIAPKSFIDATIDDVRKYERELVDACAHAQTTFFLGGGEMSTQPRVRCKEGLFDWTFDAPTSCSPACAQFQRQMTGASGRLQGLRHFYDWLLARGLVTMNVVEPVHKRHNAKLETRDEPGKYRPTLAEVRAIVRAAVAIKTPRDVAMILALAKTSRRPDHTLNLWAEDVRALGTPLAHYDYTGPREKVKRREKSTRTKLRGNLVAPLDQEHDAYLREVYIPYRRQQWGYHANEGPWFPASRSKNRAFPIDEFQDLVLDPIMRHLRDTAPTPAERAIWERHLEPGSSTRISAGCFRHFATDEWHALGVNDVDIDILRGDKIRGAKRHYMHPTPESVCRVYRMHNILSDVDAARPRRLDSFGG